MQEIAQSENIEDFIDSNFIYVDKTEYIHNLIKFVIISLFRNNVISLLLFI